ncbi:MAG: exodeoxyribonuclease VII small subunit [Deltaproteobacteria bacterium]|nr:exodeoxyribonuclease VII small subunit [Deltaproteobacteria bacterium]
MTDPAATSGVGVLSFEDALAQLESIVSELERGETPLEQTIDRFERGIALARRCEDRLNEADRKVAILLKEGARVVEVDMESGERLAVHTDPGAEPSPPSRAPAPPPPAAHPAAPAPRPAPPATAPQREPTFSSGAGGATQGSGPPGPPPRGQRSGQSAGGPPRRPAGPPVPNRDENDPTSQMSLGQAFAIKDPSEMDDDDIPF